MLQSTQPLYFRGKSPGSCSSGDVEAPFYNHQSSTSEGIQTDRKISRKLSFSPHIFRSNRVRTLALVFTLLVLVIASRAIWEGMRFGAVQDGTKIIPIPERFQNQPSISEVSRPWPRAPVLWEHESNSIIKLYQSQSATSNNVQIQRLLEPLGITVQMLDYNIAEQWIQFQKLPSQRSPVADIVVQMKRIDAALTSQSVVHNDLHCAHFLHENGQLKVFDFGESFHYNSLWALLWNPWNTNRMINYLFKRIQGKVPNQHQQFENMAQCWKA